MSKSHELAPAEWGYCVPVRRGEREHFDQIAVARRLLLLLSPASQASLLSRALQHLLSAGGWALRRRFPAGSRELGRCRCGCGCLGAWGTSRETALYFLN